MPPLPHPPQAALISLLDVAATLGTAADAFSGAVLASNGLVVFPPSGGGTIAVYDPASRAFSAVVTPSGLSATPSGYGGGAATADGRVVFAPRHADGVGIFDAATNAFSYVDVSAHLAHDDKYIGAAYAAATNQVVFAPSAADGVGVYDVASSAFGYVDISFSFASSNYGGKFRGAAAAANGLVVFAPSLWWCVGIFDPAASSFAHVDISGPSYSGEGPSPSFARYGAAAAVGVASDLVVFAPDAMAGVGLFDAANRSFTFHTTAVAFRSIFDEIDLSADGLLSSSEVALAAIHPDLTAQRRGAFWAHYWCSDGLLSPSGASCCPVSCGACGSDGCSALPGGASSCCDSGVAAAAVVCSATTEAAPCVVPTDTLPSHAGFGAAAAMPNGIVVMSQASGAVGAFDPTTGAFELITASACLLVDAGDAGDDAASCAVAGSSAAPAFSGVVAVSEGEALLAPNAASGAATSMLGLVEFGTAPRCGEHGYSAAGCEALACCDWDAARAACVRVDTGACAAHGLYGAWFAAGRRRRMTRRQMRGDDDGRSVTAMTSLQEERRSLRRRRSSRAQTSLRQAAPRSAVRVAGQLPWEQVVVGPSSMGNGSSVDGRRLQTALPGPVDGSTVSGLVWVAAGYCSSFHLVNGASNAGGWETNGAADPYECQYMASMTAECYDGGRIVSFESAGTGTCVCATDDCTDSSGFPFAPDVAVSGTDTWQTYQQLECAEGTWPMSRGCAVQLGIAKTAGETDGLHWRDGSGYLCGSCSSTGTTLAAALSSADFHGTGAAARGQSGSLGEATAGHHGLVRLHPKAWGCPPHS